MHLVEPARRLAACQPIHRASATPVQAGPKHAARPPPLVAEHLAPWPACGVGEVCATETEGDG